MTRRVVCEEFFNLLHYVLSYVEVPGLLCSFQKLVTSYILSIATGKHWVSAGTEPEKFIKGGENLTRVGLFFV